MNDAITTQTLVTKLLLTKNPELLSAETKILQWQ